jgi:dUTP pyrophosphatase
MKVDKMYTLDIFKIFPDAHLPEFGTEWSACFDLKASIRLGDTLTVYNNRNVKRVESYNGDIKLYSGERVLVPTGLIFDLREGQSIRIHPRSGLALKNGITVMNCEGVIDADYVQQTFVMLWNTSGEPFVIKDGDRIAQAEVVESTSQISFSLVCEAPIAKTDRNGGFGSTGV